MTEGGQATGVVPKHLLEVAKKRWMCLVYLFWYIKHLVELFSSGMNSQFVPLSQLPKYPNLDKHDELELPHLCKGWVVMRTNSFRKENEGFQIVGAKRLPRSALESEVTSRLEHFIVTAVDLAASSSGLRGRRRTCLTILQRAWSAKFKMVRYVLLRPLL
jgi:hypothetical protein